MNKEDVINEYEYCWKEYIETESGKINKTRLMKTLYEFNNLETKLSQVYSLITDGKIKKPSESYESVKCCFKNTYVKKEEVLKQLKTLLFLYSSDDLSKMIKDGSIDIFGGEK